MARGRSTTKLGRTAVKVARDGEKKVVLLSGGNPQIPKGDGEEPVRAYLDAMPGWKRGIGERLDALIVRIVPGVVKGVRWNLPFYGVEGKGWFLSVHCLTKYVKVTFFAGTALRPIPSGGHRRARRCGGSMFMRMSRSTRRRWRNGSGRPQFCRGGCRRWWSAVVVRVKKWHGHLARDGQTSSAGCRCHLREYLAEGVRSLEEKMAPAVVYRFPRRRFPLTPSPVSRR